MKSHVTGYATEQVRQMFEEAAGAPYTCKMITDLAKSGRILEGANRHPGFWSKKKVDRAVRGVLLRRLAAQLGRTSPRLLGSQNETTCLTCEGTAVHWAGRWLCENGHGGNTNE